MKPKAQDVARLKKALLGRRAVLRGDVNQLQDEALKVTKSEMASSDITSFADRGTDNYEQEFALGLMQTGEEELRAIDAALEKMKQGTFGLCEGCQKPIAKARLEAVPYAKLCIECKRKEESGGGGV
ncbi:MAG: TraR/DksA family transcriptional regulator [Planctomycetes bacterium]|nr:TraR/DksA family transcriptional regulator [Planctomycetota bacterium]MBM4087766.1 TraR/DksA family transcriptional regulator [Planctomycetota bacterium]